MMSNYVINVINNDLSEQKSKEKLKKTKFDFLFKL